MNKITWSSKKVAVSAIKHTPTNYKIKTDLGRERLQASLKAFGLAGNVVVNTDLTLIDGNSRLIEAKEGGEKYIWVSLPNRKLLPREFLEMSAMFDYAKAGEVDIERIQGDLGKTKDFYAKWGMEVPMALLDKLGNNKAASESGENLEFPSNGKSSSGGVEVSDIKMVQLFFSEKQEAEFRKIEEKLKLKFKTADTTNTVLKALRSIKFIVVVLLLTSCGDLQKKMAKAKLEASSTQYHSVGGMNTVAVITVDGCEYIVYDGYEKGGIVHKANCKNKHPW